MAQRLYVATGNENFVFNVVPDDGADFSLIDPARCTIEVRQPDGSEQSWPASVSNQTTTTITLTHALVADGSDLPQVGPLTFFAKMPLASGFGFFRSEAFVEAVLDRFDSSV